MTTLYNIQLTCPVCQTDFRSQRIASTNSVGQDTDFRPHTVGLDPQPHYVHVCPLCHFAAFEGDFAEVQDEVREFVLEGQHHPEQLVEAADGLELRGSTKYLLAARCYSLDTRAGELRLADLYLRASWCARQEGLPERERQAQFDAILLFEAALEKGEVDEGQRKTILYLVGELYRRVGRYELAVAMLEQALHTPSQEADPRLDRLIIRQRAAAEAHICENMQIEGA